MTQIAVYDKEGTLIAKAGTSDEDEPRFLYLETANGAKAEIVREEEEDGFES